MKNLVGTIVTLMVWIGTTLGLLYVLGVTSTELNKEITRLKEENRVLRVESILNKTECKEGP